MDPVTWADVFVEWLSSTPGRVSAWAAAWMTVSGLIWKFAERAEAVVSTQAKQLLAERLKHDIPIRQLAETFADAFDGVFGDRHLTPKCFWRSCMASTAFTTSLFFFWYTTVPQEASAFREIGLTGSLFYVAFNTVVRSWPFDYISLLKTRYCIGALRRGKVGTVGILVVDALLSSGLAALTVSWFPLLLGLGAEAFQHVPYAASFVLARSQYGVLGIFFYSTFLSSIWLWLYIASGVLLRLRVVEAWRAAVWWLKVDEVPFKVVASVSILLLACVFLVALPVVLLF